MKKIITLLTDFGDYDNYVGVMKGVIYNINPDINIIDICHNIPPQNILSGAHILNNSYSHFPHGTIHVVVIDPGVGSLRKNLLIQTENYCFIAPDNGILTPIFNKEKIIQTVSITNKNYFLPDISSTFHGRDIFAPVAAHLSRGVSINNFGESISDYIKLKNSEPVKISNGYKGKILHIDRFGNIITNFKHDHIKSNKYFMQVNNTKITKFIKTFNELKTNETGFLTGSTGNIEIVTNKNNAAELLKVDYKTDIKLIV